MFEEIERGMGLTEADFGLPAEGRNDRRPRVRRGRFECVCHSPKVPLERVEKQAQNTENEKHVKNKC